MVDKMLPSAMEKNCSIASTSRVDQINQEVTIPIKTDSQQHEVVFRDSRLSPKVRQLRRERDRVDSGYEASPSSTTGCFVFNFDDVESSVDQRVTSSTGYSSSSSSTDRRSGKHFRFDHVSLFQHSDASHIDIDPFIGKYESSSNSRRTYRESPPIPIPSVVRGSPGLESEAFQLSSSPRFEMASVPVASTAPQHSSSSPVRLSSMLNPLSWPTFRNFMSSSQIRLPSPFGTPPDSPGHACSTKFTELDDSFGLDEQTEDVFDDTEDPVIPKVPEIEVPDFEACINADDFYQQLSPEISLMSSSSPSVSSRSSGNVRRNRSVSVNLPVERDLNQVCQDVGQTLRRLSDQFSDQLTMKRTSPPRGRSNTVSGCSRSSSPSLDKSKDRSGAVVEGCSRGASGTSANKDNQIDSQKESQRRSS